MITQKNKTQQVSNNGICGTLGGKYSVIPLKFASLSKQ